MYRLFVCTKHDKRSHSIYIYVSTTCKALLSRLDAHDPQCRCRVKCRCVSGVHTKVQVLQCENYTAHADASTLEVVNDPKPDATCPFGHLLLASVQTGWLYTINGSRQLFYVKTGCDNLIRSLAAHSAAPLSSYRQTAGSPSDSQS